MKRNSNVDIKQYLENLEHCCDQATQSTAELIYDDGVPALLNIHTWKKLGKNNFFYLVK
jgi:hypothetical protein